jgi:hypothetical protein
VARGGREARTPLREHARDDEESDENRTTTNCCGSKEDGDRAPGGRGGLSLLVWYSFGEWPGKWRYGERPSD